jgi:hypothetical protein
MMSGKKYTHNINRLPKGWVLKFWVIGHSWGWLKYQNTPAITAGQMKGW